MKLKICFDCVNWIHEINHRIPPFCRKRGKGRGLRSSPRRLLELAVNLASLRPFQILSNTAPARNRTENLRIKSPQENIYHFGTFYDINLYLTMSYVKLLGTLTN